MGFFIRKSFSNGPFRLNVSKSGLGVSFGVKGLRVGSGPKGSYIRAGRGWLYYYKGLSRAGNINHLHGSIDKASRLESILNDAAQVRSEKLSSGPKGVRLAYSRWIVWSFVPLLHWIAWIHAGIQARHLQYVGLGLFYGISVLVTLWNAVFVLPWLASLGAGSWIMSIIHALIMRNTVNRRITIAKYLD